MSKGYRRVYNGQVPRSFVHGASRDISTHLGSLANRYFEKKDWLNAAECYKLEAEFKNNPIHQATALALEGVCRANLSQTAEALSCFERAKGLARGDQEQLTIIRKTQSKYLPPSIYSPRLAPSSMTQMPVGI